MAGDVFVRGYGWVSEELLEDSRDPALAAFVQEQLRRVVG